MKSKKQLVTLLLLLAASTIFSQNRNEKRRIPNTAEKAERKVEETNQQIDSTIAGIDNTIEGAKATAKKVGDIFFGKKDKKKTSKNAILITISSVSYDDENASQLYNEICKDKAAKNIVKTYSNGQLNIQMESKETADAIWQKVTQNTRTSFSISAISKNEITLNLKK